MPRTVSITHFLGTWHRALLHHEWCLQPELKPQELLNKSAWSPDRPRPGPSSLSALASPTVVATREALADSHLPPACHAPGHEPTAAPRTQLSLKPGPLLRTIGTYTKSQGWSKPPEGCSECPRCWATNGPWKEHRWLAELATQAKYPGTPCPPPPWEENGNKHLRKLKALSPPSLSQPFSNSSNDSLRQALDPASSPTPQHKPNCISE